jgi:hypothetical protein
MLKNICRCNGNTKKLYMLNARKLNITWTSAQFLERFSQICQTHSDFSLLCLSDFGWSDDYPCAIIVKFYSRVTYNFEIWVLIHRLYIYANYVWCGISFKAKYLYWAIFVPNAIRRLFFTVSLSSNSLSLIHFIICNEIA